MRARSWRFARFAALLEPGWYILPPGLFDALKLKICIKFVNVKINS